jgi:uncharacterized protein (TIGR02246 family)
MKKFQLLNIVLALFLLTVVSCKKAETASAETETTTFDLAKTKISIQAGYREFETAFNTKDSIGLANCYAIDAKFMSPNGKAIEGRTAIQKAFTGWFKDDTTKIKLHLVELWGDETNVTAENAWTMTDKDGKVIDEGKSIEVYKMEDERWKLLRDCYNSNLPATK